MSKEPKTPEQSFAELRGSLDAAKAENEELKGQISSLQTEIKETYQPAMHRSLVRESGWEPDSKPYSVLVDDLTEGRVPMPEESSTVEALRVYASERYGYEPGRGSSVTPAEQAALDAASRLSSLHSVATSDRPPNLDELSAELLAAGDVSGSISAENQKLLKAMRGN